MDWTQRFIQNRKIRFNWGRMFMQNHLAMLALSTPDKSMCVQQTTSLDCTNYFLRRMNWPVLVVLTIDCLHLTKWIEYSTWTKRRIIDPDSNGKILKGIRFALPTDSKEINNYIRVFWVKYTLNRLIEQNNWKTYQTKI